ncbi:MULTISPECIES: MerR family transcriptional regulator [Actinosynnema]|uniref:MerR family transcriptional regulator n=1 Tax=Actinosynnema TaxID=40566 RepID=UPI0027E30A30|nr:MerR family transcriptional regulator [Actinosynnema pretiosum]MCP2095317.1 MerR HTH family regulatory protein [Actinosynnema pretiosum]
MVTLSVAAAARRLGVAPATLRTWDRRYGLGPSDHTTGRHRKYAPLDVARLELMQRALLRGATSAEAAKYALSTPVPAPDAQPAPLAIGELDASAPSPAGVRGLRMPGAGRQARGLGRAALAMDSVAAQTILADAIDADGVVATWVGVVVPVLTAIAAKWEHSGAGVEVSHLLEECVAAAMTRATPLVADPRNHRPVLLACVPDERHSLPLRPLAAELARRGLGVMQLGASLPAAALASAIRRTAPAAVVLWAHLPRYADPGVVTALPRTRQQVRVFAGGPGWQRGVVPAPAERIDDLPVAVAAIERAVC